MDLLGRKKKRNEAYLKLVIVFLQVLAFGIIAYMVILPLYPSWQYRRQPEAKSLVADPASIEQVSEKTTDIRNSLPESEYAVSPNRLIIPKIGVNAPIVESASAEYGLSKGSWRVPESSTPDKGGNTVITGHRFKYLPPNNLTFYLFDKLEVGDLVSVIWEEEDYLYRIKEIKIVDKTELSILDQTTEPIITMFTCHPIYSTEQRLVVIAEKIDS